MKAVPRNFRDKWDVYTTNTLNTLKVDDPKHFRLFCKSRTTLWCGAWLPAAFVWGMGWLLGLNAAVLLYCYSTRTVVEIMAVLFWMDRPTPTRHIVPFFEVKKGSLAFVFLLISYALVTLRMLRCLGLFPLLLWDLFPVLPPVITTSKRSLHFHFYNYKQVTFASSITKSKSNRASSQKNPRMPRYAYKLFIKR